MLAHDKYLSLPTHVGRSKKKSFLPIKDRVEKRLLGWMDKLISWVGREVLIKIVAQAIITYTVGVFKLLNDIYKSIQKLITRF